MTDIVADALKSHREAMAIQKEDEEARNRVKIEQQKALYESRIAEAAEWAVPTLNRILGERDDWELTAPDPMGRLVGVKIGRGYTLTVSKNGFIEGSFKTTASHRYSNTSGIQILRVHSLTELGRYLARDIECIDEEMRYAD